jgi:N-acetylmuramoyl-L-alanine amidase
MVLEIGSRDATWNDIDIQLGFAPEFIDDQVFVHSVDLQKNIEPLLFGPPLIFGSRVIVIDPGHGGANVGTHSVLDGRLEKEFTLDWAKRLAPLLETNGWKVFLTRTSDVTMSNLDRVVFAEAHHADLFISLHFNSGAPDKKPAGLETYCLTPAGMPSTLTRGWPDLCPSGSPTTLMTRKIYNSPFVSTAHWCARWAWKIAVSVIRGSTRFCADKIARRF